MAVGSPMAGQCEGKLPRLVLAHCTCRRTGSVSQLKQQPRTAGGHGVLPLPV